MVGEGHVGGGMVTRVRSRAAGSVARSFYWRLMCICVLYDRRRKKKALFRCAPDDRAGSGCCGRGKVSFKVKCASTEPGSIPHPHRLLIISNHYVAKHTTMR